jgi:hypothetical protein
MLKIIKSLASREIVKNGPTRTVGFWEAMYDMLSFEA